MIEVILAAALQAVIVAICVALFIYVRLGLGRRARYAAHLAAGWGFMGLAYVSYPVIFSFSKAPPTGTPGQSWVVISSAMSLISSAFMLAAWYMMRDQRLEERSGAPEPLPTMSKQFVSFLIFSLNIVIAVFFAFLTKGEFKTVELILMLIDVSVACMAYFLVGLELFQMRLFSDPQEGSFFPERWAHTSFRWITLLIFATWGVMQFPVVWGKFYVNQGPAPFFKFPTGHWYTWLAVVKLLCGTCAAILIMHALPSVRWKHKQIGKRLRKKENSRLGSRT